MFSKTKHHRFCAGGIDEYIENSNYWIFARTLRNIQPARLRWSYGCSVLHLEHPFGPRRVPTNFEYSQHVLLSNFPSCDFCSLISSLTKNCTVSKSQYHHKVLGLESV